MDTRNAHGLITTTTEHGTIHRLRILDADGTEAATVTIQGEDSLLVGAVAHNVRQSLRPGWTVDYTGESSATMAMGMFGND